MITLKTSNNVSYVHKTTTAFSIGYLSGSDSADGASNYHGVLYKLKKETI